MPQRRTSLFLPPDVLKALDRLKARDGVPQAETVRRALYAYLRKMGMKVTPPSRVTARGKAK